MIFDEVVVGNSRSAVDQWADVQYARNAANLTAQSFIDNGRCTAANAGLIPQDVYREFDNVTVQRFRSDDGDTFLNDLMALSRSVSIGKLTHEFRQASDAGNAQTSMTGQIGVLLDSVDFTYDGTIIPIHDAGFGRNWREWNAQTSEGFDALIDDQRETVATLRRKLADTFMDGHRDKQNQIIVGPTGLSWSGMRADSRVAQVDLGAGGINFDFTDTLKTGDEIKAAFIQIRDTLWITNLCEKEVTYYISREIMSNFERKFSTQYDAKLIKQELADLMGVADIKVTSKLSGNELMGFPLSSDAISPIVGMGLNTVAMPRPVYNSNYDFVVWGAIGWEVRTDFNSKTCAVMAKE